MAGERRVCPMTIFEVLEQEHGLIAKVLTVADARARQVTQPGAAAEPFWAELSSFAEEFVSRRHQAKEFKLFLYLQRKEFFPVTEFVAGFLTEHCRLAQLTKSLSISLRMIEDEAASERNFFASHFAQYIALIRKHMFEEDRFYKLVASVLEPSEQFELMTGFEKLDRETAGRSGPWAQQVARVCV